MHRDFLAGFLVFLSFSFNGVLAIINQHVLPLGSLHVMGFEGLILASAALLILKYPTPEMRPWWFMGLLFIAVIFPYVALCNTFINPKAARDILIIPIFVCLGMLYQGDVRRVVAAASLVVAAVLCLETFALESYLNLFNPAHYYATTRGVGEGIEEASLFGNSEGYAGRFSIFAGLLGLHRASSIFLEQTTLANFAVVLTLYLLGFGKKLGKNAKFLYSSLIIAIILLTDSRLALGLTLVFFVMQKPFSLAPKELRFLVLPVFFLLAYVFIYDPQQIRMEDTFTGRLGWNFALLSELSLSGVLGGDFHVLPRAWDSGYMYLLASQSLLGALALWFFLVMLVPDKTVGQRKFGIALHIFLTMNFAVGATVLSLKIGGLIWFLVGALTMEKYKKREGF